ncbi:MAG: hypothetical protein JKY15_01880 [Deltaproteobacteria bacterium]|nr:hypothetical protein [Deltaproteobacteria bacterium]
MNPSHNKCGEILYTPKITFRRKGILTAEKIDHWWCRECRCFVKVTVGKQEDIEENEI